MMMFFFVMVIVWRKILIKLPFKSLVNFLGISIGSEDVKHSKETTKLF